MTWYGYYIEQCILFFNPQNHSINLLIDVALYFMTSFIDMPKYSWIGVFLGDLCRYKVYGIKSEILKRFYDGDEPVSYCFL